MLINGNQDQINLKAVGGYYSEDFIFLVKRNENTNICGVSTGGKTKKRYSKFKKTRKHIKNKKNKTRKYR
jgi:hypothetical protein